MGKSSIDWHSPIAMLNHEGIAVCWARGVLSISPGKSWKSHWHDENTPAGDNRLAMWVFAPGCDAKHRSVCSYSFQPLISGRFYASSCQGLDKSMSTSLIATTFCSMLSCTHPQSSPIIPSSHAPIIPLRHVRFFAIPSSTPVASWILEFSRIQQVGRWANPLHSQPTLGISQSSTAKRTTEWRKKT